MTHYVCPHCKGVNQTPKACDTVGCSLNGHALKECNCTDNLHAEVLAPSESQETSST